MNLNQQIKKHRVKLAISQEELADKVYVTRQTVSNWETGKNYPDIHSLLLLSSLFETSLDELVKGDLEIMKKEVNNKSVKEMARWSAIMTIGLLVAVISVSPLVKFLGWYGFLVYGILCLPGFYAALKVEKLKKAHDIQTYKGIIYFMNGKKLDEIEYEKEKGKVVIQRLIIMLALMVLAVVIVSLMWVLLEYFFATI
jgi:Predicted transcriptional regulators